MLVPTSHSRTVYFTPLVKYYEWPIRHGVPLSGHLLESGGVKEGEGAAGEGKGEKGKAEDRDPRRFRDAAIYTQFFEANEFDTMIQRILSDFRYLQKPRTLAEATEAGIVDNNIQVTLNTLFRRNNVLYIAGAPYTIVSTRWTKGDWRIASKSMEKLMSQFPYLSPNELTEQTKKEVEGIAEPLRQGSHAGLESEEAEEKEREGAHDTASLAAAAAAGSNATVQQAIAHLERAQQANAPTTIDQMPEMQEFMPFLKDLDDLNQMPTMYQRLFGESLQTNLPFNYADSTDLIRDPLTLSLLVQPDILMGYIGRLSASKRVDDKDTLIHLTEAINNTQDAKRQLQAADAHYQAACTQFGIAKSTLNQTVPEIIQALRDYNAMPKRGRGEAGATEAARLDTEGVQLPKKRTRRARAAAAAAPTGNRTMRQRRQLGGAVAKNDARREKKLALPNAPPLLPETRQLYEIVDRIVSTRTFYLGIVIELAESIMQMYEAQASYFRHLKTLLQMYQTEYANIILYFKTAPKLALDCIASDIVMLDSLIALDPLNPDSVDYFEQYNHFKQDIYAPLMRHKESLLRPTEAYKDAAVRYLRTPSILEIEKYQYELYGFKMFDEYAENQTKMWTLMLNATLLLVENMKRYATDRLTDTQMAMHVYNQKYSPEQQQAFMERNGAVGVRAQRVDVPATEQQPPQKTLEWFLVREDGSRAVVAPPAQNGDADAQALKLQYAEDRAHEKMRVELMHRRAVSYDAVIMYLYLLEIQCLRRTRYDVANENELQIKLDYSIVLDNYYQAIQGSLSEVQFDDTIGQQQQRRRPTSARFVIPHSLFWNVKKLDNMATVEDRILKNKQDYLMNERELTAIQERHQTMTDNCERIHEMLNPVLDRKTFIRQCKELIESTVSLYDSLTPLYGQPELTVDILKISGLKPDVVEVGEEAEAEAADVGKQTDEALKNNENFTYQMQMAYEYAKRENGIPIPEQPDGKPNSSITLGWELINNRGGGDCLFLAVCDALNGQMKVDGEYSVNYYADKESGQFTVSSLKRIVADSFTEQHFAHYHELLDANVFKPMLVEANKADCSQDAGDTDSDTDSDDNPLCKLMKQNQEQKVAPNAHPLGTIRADKQRFQIYDHLLQPQQPDPIVQNVIELARDYVQPGTTARDLSVIRPIFDMLVDPDTNTFRTLAQVKEYIASPCDNLGNHYWGDEMALRAIQETLRIQFILFQMFPREDVYFSQQNLYQIRVGDYVVYKNNAESEERINPGTQDAYTVLFYNSNKTVEYMDGKTVFPHKYVIENNETGARRYDVDGTDLSIAGNNLASHFRIDCSSVRDELVTNVNAAVNEEESHPTDYLPLVLLNIAPPGKPPVYHYELVCNPAIGTFLYTFDKIPDVIKWMIYRQCWRFTSEQARPNTGFGSIPEFVDWFKEMDAKAAKIRETKLQNEISKKTVNVPENLTRGENDQGNVDMMLFDAENAANDEPLKQPAAAAAVAQPAQTAPVPFTGQPAAEVQQEPVAAAEPAAGVAAAQPATAAATTNNNGNAHVFDPSLFFNPVSETAEHLPPPQTGGQGEAAAAAAFPQDAYMGGVPFPGRYPAAAYMPPYPLYPNAPGVAPFPGQPPAPMAVSTPSAFNRISDAKSKLAYQITIDLDLFPGKSANVLQQASVRCQSTFERIREAYADLFGFQYQPAPMRM